MDVKFTHTDQELASVLELRYKILRKPWGQSKESATDSLENTSYNAYITDQNNTVIACGRLQENENKTGQIRYMAVDDQQQGKGLGKLILTALEHKGKEIGLKTIELQARENALDFYKSAGYTLVEPSFKLWDIIQHYLMRKSL